VTDVVSRLVDAIDAHDDERLRNIVGDLVGAILDADTTTAATTTTDALRILRARRRFGEMLTVGDAAARAGSMTSTVSCFYAQALIEHGHTEAALRVLEVVSDHDVAAGERDGLVGRAFKQRYVDAPGSPTAPAQLRRAIAAYLTRHLVAPRRNLWHGVNAVALLARAERAGVDVAGAPDWRGLAASVLASATERYEGSSDPWDAAIAAESLVALRQFREVAPWLTRYTNTATNSAFEFASTQRQFREVWELDDRDPEQRALLEFLTARVLRAEGGQVTVSRPAAAAAVVADDAAYLEGVFGDDLYRSVRWYRAGLEASKSVVRVVRPLGATVGTGFVVPGEWLYGPWGPSLVVVTNFHVTNRAGAHPGRPPEQLRVVYEDQPPEVAIESILWESPFCGVGTNPPPTVDTAVLKPAKAPASMPSYLVRDGAGPGVGDRLYVIGYPLGQDLSFSLQDNKIVGSGNEVVHYRSPTRPGSSGSPLFDGEWHLVGLHHAGKEDLARLDDPDQTYAANEGFQIAAIRSAIYRDLGA